MTRRTKTQKPMHYIRLQAVTALYSSPRAANHSQTIRMIMDGAFPEHPFSRQYLRVLGKCLLCKSVSPSGSIAVAFFRQDIMGYRPWKDTCTFSRNHWAFYASTTFHLPPSPRHERYRQWIV
jgi:hypothetical protein